MLRYARSLTVLLFVCPALLVAAEVAQSSKSKAPATPAKPKNVAAAINTPRADGRIVRDSAALTADRKLVLATTNVTDGHKVEVSRRGSAGGCNRKIYQTDGITLIVNLADNASAAFAYDAVAALWFQL